MARATAPVTWLLTGDEAGMSHLGMPRLRGKALKLAFTGGLARDEGGRPEDWYVTWQSLSSVGGRRGNDRQPYVLYHAARDLVEQKKQEAAAWDVELRRVLPDHLALDLFYRTYGPSHGEHAVWNLVFVGQKQHFLCVSTSDAQLLIRNLPANLSETVDDHEYLQQLATEIDRSTFFARQTEHSPDVEKIIVCGDPRVAGPLVGVLAEASSIPAVHWPIEEMFQWGLNEQQPDDLVTLAGAVLALDKIPFNLLPAGGRLQLSRSLRRRLLVAAGTCAAAVVPLLLVGGVVTARVQASYLARAESRLAEAQEKAHAAERAYEAQRVLLSRENTIRRFARTRPDFESVLLRLARITPPEVVFKSLQIREQANGRFRLDLRGESQALTGARAQGAFLEFVAALDGCGFLKRVGESRLMKMIPGAGDEEQGKTTVFQLDLEWVGPTGGNG